MSAGVTVQDGQHASENQQDTFIIPLVKLSLIQVLNTPRPTGERFMGGSVVCHGLEPARSRVYSLSLA